MLQIIHDPHKTLRAKSRDIMVKDIRSSKIQRLIAEMKKTLKHTPDGVGLAAPQVGENVRLFIVSEEAEEIDRMEKKGYVRRQGEEADEARERPYEKRDWNYYMFINPVVKNTSRRKLVGSEGCLSVPGKFGTVTRLEKITVDAYNERGEKFTRGATRFFARVMQHELDHLDGVLFIDKAEFDS